MNRPIRIEPEAAVELDEASRWYDDKRPGLGRILAVAHDRREPEYWHARTRK